MTAVIDRRRSQADFCVQIPDVRQIIFLLLILQFSTGHLLGAELMKVPCLLSHYKVYHKEHPERSWVDFFCLHYADTAHRKADPAHKQLPLQSLSVNNGIAQTLPSAQPAIHVCTLPDSDDANLPHFEKTLLPSDFRMRLLRPPRV